MVFPSEQPPKKRALTDTELSARIIELQSQPDGLVAAMALIEDQTKLREIDALELARWELESQLHQAAPTTTSDPIKDFSDTLARRAQEFDRFKDLPGQSDQNEGVPAPKHAQEPSAIASETSGQETKSPEPATGQEFSATRSKSISDSMMERYPGLNIDPDDSPAASKIGFESEQGSKPADISLSEPEPVPTPLFAAANDPGEETPSIDEQEVYSVQELAEETPATQSLQEEFESIEPEPIPAPVPSVSFEQLVGSSDVSFEELESRQGEAKPQAAETEETQALDGFGEDVAEIENSLRESYSSAEEESDEALNESEMFEESVQFTNSEALEPAPITSPVATLNQEEVATSSDELVRVVEVAPPTRKIWALVWSWASFTGTPLGFVLAAYLYTTGISFGQSLILLGSVLMITAAMTGVGAIAAKRAAAGVSMVSRAAFGVWGNLLPNSLMLLIKLAWTGLLITFATRLIAPLIFSQPWFAPLAQSTGLPSEFLANGSIALVLTIIAALIAGFGGLTLLRSQQLASVASLMAFLSIGYFVFTQYSIGTLAIGNQSAWSGFGDLLIFVFLLFGLNLFSQSGDIARKLPQDTPGAQVFFITFASVLLRPLIIGSLGLTWFYLAAGDLAAEFVFDPLSSIAALMPIWIFVLFTVGMGLSVIQLIANSLYSLAGDAYALGIRPNKGVAQTLIAFLVVCGVLAASFFISVSTFLDLATQGLVLVGVIAAAWSGLVIADSLIRRTPYHEVSLNREYGFYGRFNWVSILGFLVAGGVGFGYLTPTGLLNSWCGYLLTFTPDELENVAGGLIGVAMSFGLALLVPVIFQIPRIRVQEGQYLELEQRRQELKEFLDTVE